jgi:hypothetical protein
LHKRIVKEEFIKAKRARERARAVRIINGSPKAGCSYAP